MCCVWINVCVRACVYVASSKPSAFVTPKTVIEHPQPEPIKSTTRSLRDVNLFNTTVPEIQGEIARYVIISCLSGYLADAVGNFGYLTINRSKILGLFCGFSEGS